MKPLTGRSGAPAMCVIAALAAIVLSFPPFPAHSQAGSKPNVPPGTDPGGIAVGMIGFGVDYTDPEIAPRLARDGEGEIIGWDVIDGDRHPYASARDQTDPRADRGGTALAKLMLSAYQRARLVPVRAKLDDPRSMAQAIGFLIKTPARIVALPTLDPRGETFELLRQAAGAAGRLLFIAGVEVDTAVIVPKLDNLVIVGVASQADRASTTAMVAIDAWVVPRASTMVGARAEAAPSSPAEAVALAAGLAACAQHRRDLTTGAAAKAALLALAAPAPAYPNLAVLDPLCLYGGQRF